MAALFALPCMYARALSARACPRWRNRFFAKKSKSASDPPHRKRPYMKPLPIDK
jgi:hypothetical protein